MSGEGELLRRAAHLLRQRAVGTSLAPWAEPQYDEDDCPGFPYWMIHNGGAGMTEHAVTSTFALNPNQEADARWIALVSPAVAEPLAAWLEQDADSADTHCPIWTHKRPEGWPGDVGDPWAERSREEYQRLVNGHFGNALRLARVLLGEAEAS